MTDGTYASIKTVQLECKIYRSELDRYPCSCVDPFFWKSLGSTCTFTGTSKAPTTAVRSSVAPLSSERNKCIASRNKCLTGSNKKRT